MNKFKKYIKNKDRGITLLLTIIILSTVLLIATLIVMVTITQLKLASDINNSTVAIYAADAGAEWRLYQILNGSIPPLAMDNGAVITTTVTGILPNITIKSLGSFKNTSRQFEITF